MGFVKLTMGCYMGFVMLTMGSYMGLVMLTMGCLLLKGLNGHQAPPHHHPSTHQGGSNQRCGLIDPHVPGG